MPTAAEEKVENIALQEWSSLSDACIFIKILANVANELCSGLLISVNNDFLQ